MFHQPSYHQLNRSPHHPPSPDSIGSSEDIFSHLCWSKTIPSTNLFTREQKSDVTNKRLNNKGPSSGRLERSYRTKRFRDQPLLSSSECASMYASKNCFALAHQICKTIHQWNKTLVVHLIKLHWTENIPSIAPRPAGPTLVPGSRGGPPTGTGVCTTLRVFQRVWMRP
jgi:hypothetical protein